MMLAGRVHLRPGAQDHLGHIVEQQLIQGVHHGRLTLKKETQSIHSGYSDDVPDGLAAEYRSDRRFPAVVLTGWFVARGEAGMDD